MTQRWTPEQLSIFAAVRETKANLMIEALAGAAKTTTLVELSRYLDGNTLCLAFNKKIANEMQTKMPANVKCSTLNSLGHRVWGDKIGRRLTVSTSKVHHLLIEAIEASAEADREALYESLGDISRIAAASKNHGHVPDSVAKQLGGTCRRLMTDAEFYEMLPEEPTIAQAGVIKHALIESFNLALTGNMDFADQLLLPTVMQCSFPIYANVLVDEAQDLSELNHVMLGKVAKRRIIAVGDSLQAIYAFRGAHMEGMPLLRERFKMETLYLSTTFRCPEVVCEHVRHHAHRIQVWSGNPNNPGEIRFLKSWDMNDVPPGAAILCRNNAPLFRLAIRMLKAGRRPNVWGRDVAGFLIKIMEKLGAPNMRRADAITALRTYQREKEAKMRKESAKASLAERIECILVFIENAESLGGAIILARNVFNEGGKVDLATGHKAKGAEWDEVFILDRHLLDDEGQDLNLAYVLATRAKHRLTYIEMEGYSQPDDHT